MANALNRNLKKGDRVVLRGGVVEVCGGECFGSASFTSGSALDVTIGGVPTRADGYDIDAPETMKVFAKSNGWAEAVADLEK